MTTQRIVIREGDSKIMPQSGTEVTVHYVGKLYGTETVFDSSRSRGKPFKFILGAGQVIAGWDEGVAQMCKGEICTLVCPPNKAYGKRGAPPVIPPDATLSFEVELINCTPRRK